MKNYLTRPSNTFLAVVWACCAEQERMCLHGLKNKKMMARLAPGGDSAILFFSSLSVLLRLQLDSHVIISYHTD